MINSKKNQVLVKKILLAAGSSKRYGFKNKLTEIINGKCMIKHILDTLLKVFDPGELLIIVGHEYKTIINLVNNKDVQIIHNKNYKEGIGTSISTGVKRLESTVQGVMIIPADMPFILAEDLDRLEKKFLELDCQKVVLPKHKSKIGNPAILPKSYFKTLKNLNEDFGAKSKIKSTDTVTIEAKIGTLFDIDTTTQLAKANAKI